MAKLNPNAAQTGGSQLIFSTYLGGTGADTGTAIAIDSGAANIYLTGSTNSPDFVLPTGTAAFQSCLNNPGTVVTSTTACPATSANTDAYVARMSNPTLSTTGTPNDVALTYFSYLGGGGNDSGLAIAVLDASNTALGDAVVTGTTNSGPANPPNFPVSHLPNPEHAERRAERFLCPNRYHDDCRPERGWLLRYLFRRQWCGSRHQHRGRSQPEHLFCR